MSSVAAPPHVPLPLPDVRPADEVPPPVGALVPIDHLSTGHAASRLYYDEAGQLFRHVEVARILRADAASRRPANAERAQLGVATGLIGVAVVGLVGMVTVPEIFVPATVVALTADLSALGPTVGAMVSWQKALRSYNQAHARPSWARSARSPGCKDPRRSQVANARDGQGRGSPASIAQIGAQSRS